MSIMETLWNECLKHNLFLGFSEDELPNVQSLFEQTYEENRDTTSPEFISIFSTKLKQKKFNYKDLIVENKPTIIDFSDKAEEEPIADIDRLISEKQKEREQLYANHTPNPVSSNLVTNPTPNPVSSNLLTNPVSSNPIASEVASQEHYQYQNKILEQILESQIKILKYLQKK